MSINNINDESTANDNFLWRAFVWGVLGRLFGLRGSKLFWCASLGPIGEKITGFSLEDIVAEIVRELQEKERQERLRQILIDIQSDFEKALSKPIEAEVSNALPSPPSGEQLDDAKDSKWWKAIIYPSVILVLGKRGSGKSALGYWLLELFRYWLTPYVLGIPKQAQKLLPDWIGIAQRLDEIPEDSIVLIDEAYLRYHSRESLKIQNKEMSRLVNLSRQRNQTLIFVTQEARQIDKNIASQANVVIFKEPTMLQPRFDRAELNDIVKRAKLAFGNLSGDKRSWAYVYSPDVDFMDLMENGLATFWSDKLSHAFASGEPISDGRLPEQLTREEKIVEAKELRRTGHTYREIGQRLHINESTAYNYVNDYPYKG